jgi:hypothetical protein
MIRKTDVALLLLGCMTAYPALTQNDVLATSR